MSSRPNHGQNISKHPGTYCQFSGKYREKVVFITINNIESSLGMSESQINHLLNPYKNEGRINQITQNWKLIQKTLSDIEYAYSTYIQSVHRVRPTTFIFFTSSNSLSNASQMFTNYFVAHDLTHEHYRKNPIHQQHWIMKHTIHKVDEVKYYSDFIDHIYNTGTGQLL